MLAHEVPYSVKRPVLSAFDGAYGHAENIGDFLSGETIQAQPNDFLLRTRQLTEYVMEMLAGFTALHEFNRARIRVGMR